MSPEPITFGSVCSGMEAVSVAVEPLGWRAAYLSEIEDSPISVLKHRQRARDLRNGTAPPGTVPLWGDFSALRPRHLRRFGIEPPEVLVGGTPCQAFSVAGKRQSLADDRGNLALAFVEHAHAIDLVRERAGKPGLVVLWENVPGVLSTEDNAFGCLLGGFVGSDAAVVSPLKRGRWPGVGMVSGPRARAAWRVLDAQYFGLAQRRERVFLVVCFRDRADPAAILFEPGGVRRDPPSRRKAGEGLARSLSASTGGPSAKEQQYTFVGSDGEPLNPLGEDGYALPDVAWALQERDAKGADSSTKDGHLIVEPQAFNIFPKSGQGSELRATETDLAKTLTENSGGRRTERGTRIVEPMPILEVGKRTGKSTTDPRAGTGIGDPGDPMFTLQSGAQHGVIAFSGKDHGQDARYEQSPTLRSMNHIDGNANGGGQVAVAFKPSHFTRGKDGAPNEIYPPLSADADKGDQDPIVFQTRIARNGRGQPEEIVPALNGSDAGATSDMRPVLATAMAVRRLTPRECDRLQGFPDDYSLVPHRSGMTSDSARYRMLGNSMAVPVIRWIATRITAALRP